MKIVLIEDAPDCSDYYKFLLENRGHTVTVYDDADEVVDNIEEIAKAEVVVLDLMMQLGRRISKHEASETGIAIFNRLRKINSGIPIVIVTAKSLDENWAECLKSEKTRFLLKPVTNLVDFYMTIETWS